ncbi:MAG: arylsulfatase [Sphingobium sp.]|nr:arylsulfatase [Sphingobium sp.]
MRSHLPRLTMIAAALVSTTALAGQVAVQIKGPDGKAASGVRVSVPELMRSSAPSDKDGIVILKNIPAGDVDITAAPSGFRPIQQRVTVAQNGTATLNFQLEPSDALKRAALANSEPATEHLAQKQAYLNSIKAVKGKKPNIVVILFDDLGYGDLSSYGNRLIKTPRIDAAASQGIKLEQFYSASPVCTPSRAALLSGRYPNRAHAANHVYFPTGHPMATIRRSMGWANALPKDEILLPEILSRAGYATGAFGKWHLGDQAGHRPNDFGFQDYFGILYSNDMKPETLWRNDKVDTPADQTDQATLTERITDEAIAFLRKNAEKPFFAYVPYTAPHLPHHPNPKHKGVSEGGTYGDVIEDLDTNVGRLLQTLRDLKVDDNTIIVITSDNGGDWGGSAGNLRGRKGETFEGGQRVPAFIIWPGVTKPGTVSQEMGMNFDFYATILKELNIPLPSDRIIDGADIRPLLAGGKTPHDFLYYTTVWTGSFAGVRDGHYKFRDIVADPSPLGAGGEAYNAIPSLYSLDKDNESHDVSAKHPEELERLKKQLDAFRKAYQHNPRGWIDPPSVVSR